MSTSVQGDMRKTWTRYWGEGDTLEGVTLLGRLMFRSKRKVLKRIVKSIQIDSIIEVGCGRGFTSEVFRGVDASFIGIDISAEAVLYCQKKGINAIQKGLEDVEDAYDLVESDGMLEHFLNFEPYAKHLMRISRRYVLLIQPNYDSFSGKTAAYFANILRPKANVYEFNYRINDFVSVFQDNGFSPAVVQSIFFDVFKALLFEKTTSKQSAP